MAAAGFLLLFYLPFCFLYTNFFFIWMYAEVWLLTHTPLLWAAVSKLAVFTMLQPFIGLSVTFLTEVYSNLHLYFQKTCDL